MEEFRNIDREIIAVSCWKNNPFRNRCLGHLLAGRNVGLASGLSFQNQLMVLGGAREDNPFA